MCKMWKDFYMKSNAGSTTAFLLFEMSFKSLTGKKIIIKFPDFFFIMLRRPYNNRKKGRSRNPNFEWNNVRFIRTNLFNCHNILHKTRRVISIRPGECVCVTEGSHKWPKSTFLAPFVFLDLGCYYY